MKAAIIIPARYGSTRFPGKPLVAIGGVSMLARVTEIARSAAEKFRNITVAVATEDERIAGHCAEIGVDCVMTSDVCRTGSDRVLEASQQLGGDFDFVVGLQGDAPFTPVEAPQKLIETFIGDPTCEVVTPVVRLRWSELDALREAKKTTPFSGTTCVTDKTGRALWFSKMILPAMTYSRNSWHCPKAFTKSWKAWSSYASSKTGSASVPSKSRLTQALPRQASIHPKTSCAPKSFWLIGLKIS
jgi:3-deoxy-manno-octulosonate cytidylyltransferase (CMP-KDO synthetase)